MYMYIEVYLSVVLSSIHKTFLDYVVLRESCSSYCKDINPKHNRIFISEEEDIEWVKEIMTGVLAARGALETARRPRGTRTSPGLSCRDLKSSHANMTDGTILL